MSKYLEELTEAMTWLGEKPDTLFLGQTVEYDGTPMFPTFKNVSENKRVEFPVAENLQMGVSLGLALEGFVPVSVFPRWNFLLCACDQLVNHLDRLPLYSGYRPRVIVRTSVGRSRPLDPGPQHKDDPTEAFKSILQTVKVVGPLRRDQDAVNAYRHAYESGGSHLIVEDGNLYQ